MFGNEVYKLAIKLIYFFYLIRKMISLNHATHTYTVNDKPFISVTTLLSTWFAKFDADKVLAKMNTDRPKEEIKAEWELKGKIACE